MISNEKKHKKHAQINRPKYGYFGRNEWGFIGAPCGVIQQLTKGIIETIGKQCKVAYVDAEHKNADDENAEILDAHLDYTDKITFHQFQTNATLSEYQHRVYFNEQDLILVNGNHFKTKKQVVIIHEKKRASLSRKLDKLTNVGLIILDEEVNGIFDFVQEHLYHLIKEIPVLKINEVERIAHFLWSDWKEQIPPIYGMVLAGGKSERMGKDKSLMDYHGTSQRQHLTQLLNQFCEKTFLSCRPEQTQEIQDFEVLPDTFMGLGPMGAILSAFQKYPNHAHLVVACDLPLLDKNTLEELIQQRNPSKIVTAFHNHQTGFTEPLIALWEPKAYPVLLQFLAQGYACPRKVLINSDINELKPQNPTSLMNVNRPEEVDKVMELLAKK